MRLTFSEREAALLRLFVSIHWCEVSSSADSFLEELEHSELNPFAQRYFLAKLGLDEGLI